MPPQPTADRLPWGWWWSVEAGYTGGVNVFAHVAVAGRAGGAPDRFLLGAALSDLASFGGFRLLGRSPDDAVRAGMAFHHLSDDAFHGHEWFRSRNRRAAAALEQAGLGRGAARACAHVGIELLLDGALHPSHGDRRRFERALAAIDGCRPDLEPLVPPDRVPPWSAHLDRVAAVRGLPPHRDPEAVAQRLHAICGRRPRLAFHADRITAVAEVLAELAPGIDDSGPALVDELAARLSPHAVR